jgi:hypothetical protein
VPGGANRAVEVEGFPQRPVGQWRIANHGSQAAAQLQDSRPQRATVDRRDQVLGTFESGLDLGAGHDAIRRQQGRHQSELRKRIVVEAATGAPQIDAFACPSIARVTCIQVNTSSSRASSATRSAVLTWFHASVRRPKNIRACARTWRAPARGL